MTIPWSLTPIVKIDIVDAAELREALGTGAAVIGINFYDTAIVSFLAKADEGIFSCGSRRAPCLHFPFLRNIEVVENTADYRRDWKLRIAWL